MRHPNRPKEVHGVPQLAALDVLITLELDAPYFDLRPFTHDKCHAHRCRWYRPNFRTDGGELVPVLRQQLPDDHFGLLDLGGIVLRFGRDSDLLLLKAVENVTF